MAQRSEKKRYQVSCPCDRYTPFRFRWLNRRGGFDTYTFRLKHKRSVDTKTEEFSRFLGTAQANGSLGYTYGDRGRTVFDVSSVEAFEVVSTWQDQATHDWLEQLFSSPEVYLVTELGNDPVIVTKLGVEFRNREGVGNRLLSHTVQFVMAYPKSIQRG